MSSNEQVVLKDYPLWVWLGGLLNFVIADLTAESAWEFYLLTLVSVIVITFASILTVTVDHERGTLILCYRSLFLVSTKAYPLNEICFVNVAEGKKYESNYRVELVLRSGQVVPLRDIYTVGKERKERRAQRLRSVLGVGGEVQEIGRGLRLQSPKH